ncbi:TPA: hypothetical protein ACWMIX_001914 [Staphylococcus aureus]
MGIFSAYIVIFIACAYVIYRRIEEVSEEVDELQRDIKKNEKLLENYKKENRPIEYIVELNDGVYFRKKHTDAFAQRTTYIITNNIFEAKSYDNLLSAKIDAEILNGRVLKYKPNLEEVG